MVALLISIISHGFAADKKPFRLVRTVNIGYPQNQLPTEVLIDGEPNPCYFQQEEFHKTTTIFHGTAVEPSIAVNPTNPSNIVAVWQQDRVNNGGALEMGSAYSFDGGKTWTRMTVPLQICNGGITQRITDVWLSFSPTGRLFLTSFNLNASPSSQTPNQSSMSALFSDDGGITWSLPQSVIQSALTNSGPFQFPFFDKNSITADPNRVENAYLVWDQFPNQNVTYYGPAFFSRTTDGGITWTPGTVAYDLFPDLCVQGLSTCNFNLLGRGSPGQQTLGNVVTVLPPSFGGHLLNMTLRFYPTPKATPKKFLNDGPITFFFRKLDIVVVRSQDQAANWNGTATVVVPNTDFAGNGGAVQISPTVYTGGFKYDKFGNPLRGIGTMMRVGGEGPSINMNPKNGFLYLVYQTPQFRDDFLNQIGISTSRDGGYTWSDRVRINRTPQNGPNPQAFTPFVAITEGGYVGVLYYDFRKDPTPVPNTKKKTLLDSWLAIYKEVKDPSGGSTGIGLDFVQEIRLSRHSFIAQNGPATTEGVMTAGDYAFLTTHKNNFYAVTTQSFNGPFTPPSLFFKDPAHKAKVFLDDNHRQAPFVSIIKFSGK